MRAHLAEDLLDALAGLARLALLDEVGVLDRAGRVEHHADAVPAADPPDRGDIGEADGLPPRHVHAALKADIGNPVRAEPYDDLFEFFEVHVALEGGLVSRVVGLIADYVHEPPAREFLMGAGGGEVHVPGDHVPRADEHPAQEVLGAAPLVRRDQVRVPVIPADGLLEVVEVLAPRVGLVPQHQPGPLAVAHRARARVRQQVDVDIAAAEQEGVVPRLRNRPLPLRAGRHPQRLDHLDLERLGPGTRWHGSSPSCAPEGAGGRVTNGPATPASGRTICGSLCPL